MQFLSIKNFETFQHYRTRRPPWIKLYQTLLEDYAFTRLPSAAKWHLVGLFLLASRYDNKIPYDLPWITTEIKATEPIEMTDLVTAGFVTVCDASTTLARRKQRASKSPAPRKQSAMIERERETERETDTDSTSLASAVEQVIARRKLLAPTSRPDEKQRKLIRRALGLGYTADDLCVALEGASADDWCHDTGNTGIAYVFRDAATIDKYAAKGRNGSAPMVELIDGIPTPEFLALTAPRGVR